MSQFEYEDRTTETPEMAVSRQIEAVSNAIIGTAIVASQGSPTIGLGAMVLALGQIVARTGAPIDEIIDGIRKAHESAVGNLPPKTRLSDA